MVGSWTQVKEIVRRYGTKGYCPMVAVAMPA